MENYRVAYDSFAASSGEVLARLIMHGKQGLQEHFVQAPARWHPNGFAVFRLNDAHPLGALRLHIWPSQAGPTRSDSPSIHSHAWHLYSHILAGTYRETLYDIGDDLQDGKEVYSASIDYANAPDEFHMGPRVRIKPSAEVECRAGQEHGVPAGVPHSTHIPDGALTATLLLTSPLQQGKVVVAGEDPISPTTYQRPELTVQERRRVLNELEDVTWSAETA